MNKNIKRMFFVLTLVTLLATVGVVCAADDTNSTLSDTTVSDTISDTIVAEPATSTSNDNKIDTKTIEKEEKNLKTATKTVDVNNYDELITAMNNAVNDTANNEYIINLNEGTYKIFNTTHLKPGNSQPNITINGNQQHLTAGGISQAFNLTNTCNVTINDLTFEHYFNNYANTLLNRVSFTVDSYSYSNLTLKNMNLNKGIYNHGTLIIGENVSYSDGFYIYGSGNVITDNESKIIPYYYTYNGTYIIENMTFNSGKDNYGNLTLKNCTINAKITNYGNLTICDDVIFGSSFDLINYGELNTNISDKIGPYLSFYNDNYNLENITISSRKTNNGTLTIRNSAINHILTNNGNLTLINDTIKSKRAPVNNAGGVIYLDNLTVNTPFTNEGTLIIGDNVTIGTSFLINGQGTIVTNKTNIIQYMAYWNGNYTLENVTDKNPHTNEGFLTIKNSTILGNMNNYGTIHAINSTLNSSITSMGMNKPTGTFIFEDDVLFGTNFKIGSSDYIIIMNDTSRITPYLSFYIGDKLLENYTIGNPRTNKGNLTTRNVTFNYAFTNNKNLTIENSTLLKDLTNDGSTTIRNSTLNNRIANNNILILEDNNTYGSSFTITGSGKIIASDINEVFPYINEFTGETTIELGDYTKTISNSGNLTIENSTLTNNYSNYNNKNGNLIIRNSTIQMNIQNQGILELHNITLNSTINNQGTLILGDDVILGENFNLQSTGEVITNDTEKFIDYLTTYTGNVVLNNKNITTPKTNKGTLTLNNSIINSTIRNDGKIIIDDNTVFGENAQITGIGEIETNDITKILPIIEAINGNFVINDVTLNKSYLFNGEVTLNNCNISNSNNTNFGILNLNNCTVNVGEGNNFIDNYGNLIIRKDTDVIGEINNLGGQTSYSDAPKVYVVNNRTVTYFFDNTGLTSMVKEGDILDFQGTISRVPNISFTINKPINIITTTHDGKIDNYAVVNFTKESSGSNVTGLYTHNTQFYVWNADHIIFDNISNVVEDKQVGWGVGQTSIRENSSYITVKNSYFYTKNNGGSSTLVLAWANYCTIQNNTIIGGGNNGNLLYLTTYNVEIPDGAVFNSYNKLINNTLIGPENPADICYGISISGSGNIVDGNNLTYSGQGIVAQWGSGIDGVISEESAFNSTDNVICNNNLYGGCGISSGDLIYNNYVEGTLRVTKLAYNNTVKTVQISRNDIELINNTILGPITIQTNIQSAQIINNTITGNINIPQTSTNITITGNNITGTINLNGSSNIITNNSITTNDEYTITTRRSNNDNMITDNYLIAKTLTGDKSVNLNKETNTIENNMPYENILKVDTTEFTAGQNTTITASIYYGKEINTNITKGKVTFKVNGKTLKDTNGKVIYAKVVNGTATIENYEVPQDWAKDGTTIQAVYSGSTQCEKLTSEKTNITVTPEETTLTITPLDSVTPGQTTTLTATLSDNTINTGKIVFKINGKTVKDANGKVIYAKVVNGTVSVDYTLPESYKAGNYTVTATFIASGYDRLEASETLTVTA